ncbi:MAG TPA: CdaR family protein [Candidatus Dormibacteraeota bacterium]|nr:CdaR family protein [Candidatus Dormibacteraeota bacterium]
MGAPRFLLRNWRLKLLALAVACGMWIGVVYASNPPAIGTYYVIPQVVGLSSNLLVLYPLKSVPIKVGGVYSNVHNPQVKEHLSASVDLSSIKGPGVYQVHLGSAIADPNVFFWSAPAQVTVTIDRWETALLPVRVVVPSRNLPQAGYQFNSQATTSTPADVKVRAPASIMARVQAEVSLDLSSWHASVPLTENVVVVIPKGVPSSDVTWSPGVVTVHAVITSEANQVTLPVDYILSGQVASGYQVTSAQVTPLTVTATGPPGTVDGLGALNTQPINISGINKDTTYQVNLNVPTGVTTSVSTVTVVVIVAQLPSAIASPSPTPIPTP